MIVMSLTADNSFIQHVFDHLIYTLSLSVTTMLLVGVILFSGIIGKGSIDNT